MDLKLSLLAVLCMLTIQICLAEDEDAKVERENQGDADGSLERNQNMEGTKQQKSRGIGRQKSKKLRRLCKDNGDGDRSSDKKSGKKLQKFRLRCKDINNDKSHLKLLKQHNKETKDVDPSAGNDILDIKTSTRVDKTDTREHLQGSKLKSRGFGNKEFRKLRRRCRDKDAAENDLFQSSDLLDKKSGKKLQKFRLRCKDINNDKSHLKLLKQYNKEMTDLMKGVKNVVDPSAGDDILDMKTITELDKTDAGDHLQDCRPSELYELRKRLVSWFDLLYEEDPQQHRNKHNRKKLGKRHHKTALHKSDTLHDTDDIQKHDVPGEKQLNVQKRAVKDQNNLESHRRCECSRAAMWEFGKMDASNDNQLNEEELESIESNRREPCLKPLIKSCDTDSDGILSKGEWCCCMAYTVPPCLEKKRLSDKSVWVPRCDKEGFFEREQCHTSGHCWCVDINGNEIKDTKIMGTAHCGKYDPNGHLIKQK